VRKCLQQWLTVYDLAKVGVVGSNPIARSKFLLSINMLFRADERPVPAVLARGSTGEAKNVASSSWLRADGRKKLSAPRRVFPAGPSVRLSELTRSVRDSQPRISDASGGQRVIRNPVSYEIWCQRGSDNAVR